MISDKNFKIKDIIFIFLPLVAAMALQVCVSTFDTMIIFIKNAIEDRALSAGESASSVMNESLAHPSNVAWIFFAQYLLYAVTFGIWYYYAFVRKENIFKNKKTARFISTGKAVASHIWYNAKRTLSTKLVAFIVILGVCSQILTDAILSMFHDIFPVYFEEYDEMLSSVTAAYASPVMLFAVFILAPIGEEFLFRGLILNYSGKIFKSTLVAFLNGLLFALYHGNLIQGIYAFIFGLLLACMTLHFKSVIPGIILHIAINSSMIFIPAILFETYKSTIITAVVTLIIFIVLIFGIFEPGKLSIRRLHIKKGRES